jgi:hypothetical protein
MSEMKGWIKLHRKIITSKYGGNLEMIGLFSSLLLMANHKDGFCPDGTEIKKGSFMTSQKKLAGVFGLDRLAMRRKLQSLENAHQIKQQTSSRNTIISIVNWSEYQAIEQLNEQQTNIKRTSSEHQVNTNKNANNEKNDNNFIFDDVTQLWNTKCAGQGNLKHSLGVKRDTLENFVSLISLNPELKKIETWSNCFDAINKSDFLKGLEDSSSFVCTLNWLIGKEKIIDVLNGQYGACSANGDSDDKFKYLFDKYEGNEATL